MRRFSEHAKSNDPNVVLGLDAPDDAAVYKVTDDIALVQTVDFFTPIVDDPYEWGVIAAANSFSDVYAMGGRPKLALNLTAWPMDLDFELLSRVLEGGADKASEAGVSVIGGHTVDDREPKYGMAVTGLVHPDRIVRSSGATPDLELVLTKPLSMGVVSTAIKHEKAPESLIREAVRVMATLNQGAAEAMIEIEAKAATDITGFGLIGHLRSLAKLSGVAAELWWSEIPLLEHVLDLADQGLVPGGTRRNQDFYQEFTDLDAGIQQTAATILFDAQTSGGLLIAVDPARTSDLVALLDEKSTPAAAVIGKTVAGVPGRIRVKSSR